MLQLDQSVKSVRNLLQVYKVPQDLPVTLPQATHSGTFTQNLGNQVSHENSIELKKIND
jgi:hypothetical protein